MLRKCIVNAIRILQGVISWQQQNAADCQAENSCCQHFSAASQKPLKSHSRKDTNAEIGNHSKNTDEKANIEIRQHRQC